MANRRDSLDHAEQALDGLRKALRHIRAVDGDDGAGPALDTLRAIEDVERSRRRLRYQLGDLVEGTEEHWRAAAEARGWVATRGPFGRKAVTASNSRQEVMADAATWRELCEQHGIKPARQRNSAESAAREAATAAGWRLFDHASHLIGRRWCPVFRAPSAGAVNRDVAARNWQHLCELEGIAIPEAAAHG